MPLNGAYETARDTKMGPIYDAYREAILRATSILDEFDRWKGGLFITVENINLLPTIAERSVELQEELTRTEELAFRDKAERLTSDIQRLVNGEAENRATVAALCRIYFCELTSRRSMAGLIRACRRPALAGNPLCVSQSGEIVSGTLTVDFNGTQSVRYRRSLPRGGGRSGLHRGGHEPHASATCLAGLP